MTRSSKSIPPLYYLSHSITNKISWLQAETIKIFEEVRGLRSPLEFLQ